MFKYYIKNDSQYLLVRKDDTMRKSAALMILLMPGLISTALAAEATGTYAEARAMAVQNNQPLLVDFSTSW